MSGLEELLALAQDWLMLGIGVFLRLGAAILVLPAIGEQYVPMRVRLGAALALTVLIAPALSTPVGITSTENLLLTEPLNGLLIGISLRLLVHTLQVAGSMAAQSTSLSQLLGGAAADPQPAMAMLLTISGLTLAVMLGLHVALARLLIRSYEILPAGQFPIASDLASWGVARVGSSFALAFSLAAPFLVGATLYNLALGVINKAMPQLMVAFVGAPAITFGGLALLLISAPFILPIWSEHFQSALINPFAGAP